jgi:hypothetical protein
MVVNPLPIGERVAKRSEARRSGVRGGDSKNNVEPCEAPHPLPLSPPGRGEAAPTLGEDAQAVGRRLPADPRVGGREVGRRPTPHGAESPLPQMSPFDETLSDYHTMDMTVGPHLIEHYRHDLTKKGIVSASSLSKLRSGKRVTTAGAVIVRQRPGTAKGFVFLTLEDETGMSQAIVHPDLFREYRALIVGSPGLVVEGILQNGPGQPSVKAERFWPLDNFAPVPSHDFH